MKLRKPRRLTANAVKRSRSLLRVDPTRTITLRRQFATEIRKRFARLKGRILSLIVQEDALGLAERKPVTVNVQWPLAVPVQRQDYNYDCGAAAYVSVARYFGVEPETEAEAIRALGTSPGDGTEPEQIEALATKQGLWVSSRLGMSLTDLDSLTRLGIPVICAIQDYGTPEAYAADESGHWVVVTGVDRRDVHVMDPSAGLVSLDRDTFEQHWHDRGRIADVRYIRLGIAVGKSPLVANARQWAFSTSTEKLRNFQAWLRQQIDAVGLSDKQLWDKYIQTGFSKGAGRSFDDVRGKAKERGVDLSRSLGAAEGVSDFYQGTKEEFLRSAFAQPVAKEKVELLASRTFDEMESVTDDMANRMGRVLADGMVQGKGPREVARDLNAQTDLGKDRALVVARTELIRSHSEGQLTALKQLGVKEVGAQVEWVTAGFNVCPECASMEGTVVDIDKASGMIPAHPNCRCAWVPANVGEEDEDAQAAEAPDAEEEDATENALNSFSRWRVHNGWVTLDNDQRVFIGEGGEFMPRGPGSEPVATKKSGATSQKDLTSPDKGTTIDSGGGNKSQPEKAMKVVKSTSSRKVDAYAHGNLLQHGGQWHVIQDHTIRGNDQGGYEHHLTLRPATEAEAKKGQVAQLTKQRDAITGYQHATEKGRAEWLRLENEIRRLEGRPSHEEEKRQTADAAQAAHEKNWREGNVYDRLSAGTLQAVANRPDSPLHGRSSFADLSAATGIPAGRLMSLDDSDQPEVTDHEVRQIAKAIGLTFEQIKDGTGAVPQLGR